MRIQRIDSGIPYDSNIYLVTGERTMLVDAGSGNGHGLVVEGIRRALDGRDLDMIVATHCHYDHIGGLRALMDEFGCEAYAEEHDAPHIRDGNDRYVLASAFGGTAVPADVRSLKDGDTVDLGDVRFKVIWTPGHTEGSMCLHDQVSGVLFSGDTLFDGGVGRTDFPGGSMDALRRSVLSLSNIDIRELYPGHGNICENYGPAMMERIKYMVGV